MNPVRVAVVGATGAVGGEVLRILEERSFPVAALTAMATARSAGRRLPFAGGEVEVIETTEAAFDGIQIALFDTPDEAALDWVPKAQAHGVVCIDNSAAFRMRADVPLVVPEINPDAAARHHGIIANPNCTMMTLIMPLAPLHRAFGARHVVVSSYQSVSGAGVAGVDDLYEQIEKLTPERDAVRRGNVEGLVSPGRAFAHPIAYNVIPHVGSFDYGGDTSEERRVVEETQKILGAPVEIFATAVRVPTIAGHGVSAWIEFAKKVTPDQARAVLAEAAGVEVVDDPAAKRYPTALASAGKDKALVGRIRADASNPNAIGFFATCDNLRKGAALNAVQIAELLVERDLI